MRFRKHSEVEGRHAPLSPSKYHWINYDDEKLLTSYDKQMTAALGTRLHQLANDMIKLGVKPQRTTQTFNMYVWDCINWRMKTEVPLVATENAFGTADAIDFTGDPANPTPDDVLRIFDLKNGVTPGHEEQLNLYAAYFCIEYGVNPLLIGYDLRLYQNDDVVEFDTDPEEIAMLILITRHADAILKTQQEV